MEDIAEIMSEGPGGTPEEEFLAGGYDIVDASRLTTDAGMTAHRGVLVGDEYIDDAALRAAVEDSLGYSYADVSAVYRQGRLSPEQRQLRERIDSRLLALSRSGGNMTLLADALDLGGSTVDRAIARAKEREVAPIVKRPAVVTALVCFKCGGPNAKPRKRRHSKSPSQWVGSVNLCDTDYALGFEHRPGNPAYWQFRERV